MLTRRKQIEAIVRGKKLGTCVLQTLNAGNTTRVLKANLKFERLGQIINYKQKLDSQSAPCNYRVKGRAN